MARFLGSRSSVVAVAAAAAVASCGGEAPPPAQAPAAAAAAPAPKNAVAPEAASAAAAPAAPVEAPKPAAPTPVAKYTGLAKPESVLYDADNDRYLVSNINGSPFDKDNNGFISVLSPDGQVTTLKWIEGGKNKVKLDAPKGSAIVKGTLYVADLTVVRMFDLKSGAPKGEIAIAGSTFLNDVAAGPDGKVYVSDSAMKAGASGNFEPTSTDAVYVIDKGKAKALAKSAELHQPNGVAWTDKGLVVCTLGASEVFRLDEKGAKQDVTKTPAGHLDGLLQLGDSLLVTSHEASAVLRGKLGGTFETALAEQKTPADIGYDAKRGRLLVPHLGEDTVEAYELK
jgi:sugar lactone lactonase YvrE